MADLPDSLDVHTRLPTSEDAAPGNDDNSPSCSLPFVLDILGSNQLNKTAQTSDPNSDKEKQFLNAATVIEWASANLNFSVSLCRLEFGYNGVPEAPLCLLVFSFSFHIFETRNRISQATIDVAFEDQGPLQSNGTRTEIHSGNPFGIIDLAPRNQQDTPSVVPTINTVQASLLPMGTIMLGATVSSQQTSCARICGTPRIGKPLAKEAHFTLSENSLTRGGVPTKVTCAILLQTAPDRKYVAKVRANVKINQWVFRTKAIREANIHFEPVANASCQGAGPVLDSKQKATGKVVGGKVRIEKDSYGPRQQAVGDLSHLVPDLQPGKPSGLEALADVQWWQCKLDKEE
ncbi:hypothetical protein GP486_001884 [Trichoglossum hirsutum]|uniref:Uncharacterized protein n=1 Tax=Trichoglossum hirsutum TaxID=265104 RepID=A0A9P8RSL9_9PEZI|nr:hypothetical protein GP486_001884 [Trichoglossum hirsutum]